MRYKHFFFFCIFCKKNRKIKMATIFGKTIFFLENWDGYSAEIPCGSNILSKLLYLARFSRYKQFCNFCEKFKMAAILGETNMFWKLGWLLCSHPVVKKFCQNRSIYHSFQDISIFVFFNFCKKFKMAAILGEKFFF